MSKNLSYSLFKTKIFDYYEKNKRDFPWRTTRDPYKILVSEIMLQQTQTDRVISKYKSWLTKFPTAKVLSNASLQSVLTEWQGLGYNRRALALKNAATVITEKYKGKFPENYEEILDLPGVGPYTAGAIMAFAFNKPVPIIETNIRTVYIHEFGGKKKKIDDTELLKLIEATLDYENPRDWYHALMDYGVMLKKTVGNVNIKSKHYAKQSPFKGSDRELRAAIVRAITISPNTSLKLFAQLKKEYPHITKEKMKLIMKSLKKEGFIKMTSGKIKI